MSILSTVTTQRALRPPRQVIFGDEKTGKSTYAASSPDVLMLPIEDGLDDLDGVAAVPREELATFQGVMTTLYELATEEHPYRHVGIDSLDWLEPLVNAYVCEQNDWLDANGKPDIEKPGYGKGHDAARNAWREYLGLIDQLRDRGIGVVQIAHATIKTVKRPDVDPYDRVTMKLSEKTAKLILEAAEIIGYAHAPIIVTEEQIKGQGPKAKMIRGKLIKGKPNQLRLRGVAGVACGSRISGLPDVVDLDWQSVAQHVPYYQQQGGQPAGA